MTARRMNSPVTADRDQCRYFIICGITGKLVANEIVSPTEAVVAIAKSIPDPLDYYKVLKEVILHNGSVRVLLGP